MFTERTETNRKETKMTLEQKKLNDRKRAVALKLVNAPEHQGNGAGNLNDSHLCYLQPGNKVYICAKYVDLRGAVPGIGVFFGEPIKKQYLAGLKKLVLPKSFLMDDNSITPKDTGWVVFCKEDCRHFDDMHRQIVNPGNSFKAWKALYKILLDWAKKTFPSNPVIFYSRECVARLTRSSFTTYP